MIRSAKDRLLVKLIEVKKEQKGFLIVPEAKKDFQIAEVITCDLESTGIRPGEYVYTRKYAGLLLEFEGQEYLSLKVEEILAISDVLA